MSIIGREESHPMPHPRYASGEISRIGQELYERSIRSHVETEQNIGKIISIDIETGDYEIGNDPVETARRLLARHPGAALYGARIGYDASYTLGGTLNRTAP
jgi:hypothetical protein